MIFLPIFLSVLVGALHSEAFRDYSQYGKWNPKNYTKTFISSERAVPVVEQTYRKSYGSPETNNPIYWKGGQPQGLSNVNSNPMGWKFPAQRPQEILMESPYTKTQYAPESFKVVQPMILNRTQLATQNTKPYVGYITRTFDDSGMTQRQQMVYPTPQPAQRSQIPNLYNGNVVYPQYKTATGNTVTYGYKRQVYPSNNYNAERREVVETNPSTYGWRQPAQSRPYNLPVEAGNAPAYNPHAARYENFQQSEVEPEFTQQSMPLTYDPQVLPQNFVKG